MQAARVAIMVALVLLFSVSCWTQSSRPSDVSARERLIGAWRLVSDEVIVNGKSTKLDQTGILTYTSDGHMSVQIMDRDPSPTQDAGPVQYSANGYEGYFGRFEINVAAHSVTHHVEGALVRSLVGKDLTRIYIFSGKQLILKSSRADENWRIVWEHY